MVRTADFKSAVIFLRRTGRRKEILAGSHIKTQEELQEMAGFLRETGHFARETDRQWRERMWQLDEFQKARDQALDARIDKLVGGIGEFIRRQPDSKPN